ncbi:pyridoxal-phosphate-dependent aminotransferase family protein [Haliangium ochraceum]|uniref:Serine--pyruvate transaminase n=1 Tax=Haliangium ochraceum (strain DSM 14365 / JCM 11303 / SMP-2) TaxID=502025 RepID=D0LXY3_HALO1|nr:alanine--glyoxylate aminotransferase family protein [Haliangium ochraceum]ACY14338.1 Serine--pyruvate transaminase [Haliangium ochraceum DSM 14365]
MDTSTPERVLMGPGPSDVPARVLQALARPTVGHLDPFFLRCMDEIRSRLRTVFATENEMTLAVSGTGSAGMETLFVNLVEPGDKVLVGRCGVFGNRMSDVAERCGGEVVTVDAPWGQPIEPGQMIKAIEQHKPKVVAIVHAETSTGVHQPLDGIADATHEVGGLLLLDCVTSLGGMPVEIDAWGVDAAYSGTQKCLSCPPGLAPVTLSSRAVQRLDARKHKVQSWYLDLSMVRNYWGGERAYHHTAPVNMLYALHEALGMVLEEGLEARFARHREVHGTLRDGLDELGVSFVSAAGFRLPMLNAVGVPAGVDDAGTRKRLLEDYGIEIGGGLGDFRGKAWRIGLMGHAASLRNVTLLLAALRDITRG